MKPPLDPAPYNQSPIFVFRRKYEHRIGGERELSAAIIRTIAPAEELALKQAELTSLKAELTDRELFLANLRLELSAFESRYLREVGVLYAELDEWNARIAELDAERCGTDEARTAAAEARTAANESYATAHGEAGNASSFLPSPELKTLYRTVTKRIHPDLGMTEADRELRGRLMGEANDAFRRGDADALRAILEEYEASPESVQSAGNAATLQRVLLQIKIVLARIKVIELEITILVESDVAKLMAKIQRHETPNNDPLIYIGADVQEKIREAHLPYDSMKRGIFRNG